MGIQVAAAPDMPSSRPRPRPPSPSPSPSPCTMALTRFGGHRVELRSRHPILEIDRAAVADRGVQPLPIVEALDVLEDSELRLCVCLEDAAADELGLEGAEEAFRAGVVPAVGPPAHAADKTVLAKQLTVLGAGVLRASVGMVDEPGRGVTRLECIVQRVQADLGFERVAGCPSDDAS